MDAREEALAAVVRGWSVIPVKANSKIPLGEWKQAQSIPAQTNDVEAMFQVTGTNYGVVCGSVSGIVVLDIDPRHGGDESAKELFRANGGRPTTPMLQTSGGGWHLYFALQDIQVRNSAGSIGPGLDVRGEGGFVVGAGSTRDGKQYRWLSGLSPTEVPLASIPSYLHEIGRAPVTTISDLADEMIEEGQRHEVLLRMAGVMRRGGLDPIAIEAALLSQNQTHCSPSMDVEDVIRIAKGSAEWEKGEQPRTFHFLDPGEWLSEPEVPTEWLVDGILPTGSLTMICSPQKAGKSTFVRHLAIAIAHGEQFLGREVKQGRVLYLAIEEPPHLVRNAFRRLGITESTPLKLHDGRVPPEAFERLNESIATDKPALVVIDTVGRMRNGKLELNDYTSSLEWLEPLLFTAHSSGTTILLLYHDNKAGRNTIGYEATFSILGSVGIAATIDQLIGVRRKPDKSRTFFTVGRYGDIEEQVLAFDEDTQRLTVLGTSQDVGVEKAREVILFLLDEAEEPMESKDVKAQVGGTASFTTDAIRQLIASGLIERSGKGRSGDPYKYFRSSILTTGTNGRTDSSDDEREAF